MSRYVLQFYKKDNMRYISHLDLLRLFKRAFKRVGIKLVHSQGFNPHPKMSFVQPLSLGYSSAGEYLEFETAEPLTPGNISQKLNAAMPAGVGITACKELAPSKKTLAALVDSAAYHIYMPVKQGLDWKDKIDPFLSQKQILVEKRQKKSGKVIEQDIRPMILSMKALEEREPGHDSGGAVSVDHNCISLTVFIKAGSNCNLNPEALLSAFCGYCGLPYGQEPASIARMELFYTRQPGGELTPMLQYEA